MGYKRPETIYTLQFEEHEGLEVRVASVPLGKMLELAETADRLRAGTASTFQEAKGLFETFAERLRAWNLEDDNGVALECHLDEVLALEFGFATSMVLAWFDAIGQVSDPLERRSTGGLPSEVPSIPTQAM